MEESTGLHASTETVAEGDSRTEASRRGPTWHGWVLSLLAAIILSVTATLLLGGSGVFRSDSAIGPAVGHSGSGAGRSCCPPADAGK